MKNLLNKMLIPQDKANHFVWTMFIFNVILSFMVFSAISIKDVFGLTLGTVEIICVSVFITLLIGVIKEIRDYKTGKGTPSIYDLLANLCGIVLMLGSMMLLKIASSH